MEVVAMSLVLSMFSAVSDPRASNARHRLVDIFSITLLAMLAGADDYPGIVEFATDRVDSLMAASTAEKSGPQTSSTGSPPSNAPNGPDFDPSSSWIPPANCPAGLNSSAGIISAACRPTPKNPAG